MVTVRPNATVMADHTRAEQRTKGGFTWKYAPIELNPTDFVQDFKTKLVSMVRPNWNPDSLGVRIFEDGVTNKLVGIHERENQEDMVLLRLNGDGTENFIERELEMFVMLALNEAGLIPPVYLQLKNGLCYGFAPGRHVFVDEMSDEAMMRRNAHTIARLHAVEVPELLRQRKPQIWAKIDEWMGKVPGEFSDPEKNKW